MIRASKAEIIGTVAMMILLVQAVTVLHPILKVIIYKKNPTAPESINHFISAVFGAFILYINIKTSKTHDAIK
jgi:di/tricarboxylate transporter